MPSECVFQLNRENAVYFAGEVISGTVTLTTEKLKHVNEIAIKIYGRTKVRWRAGDDPFTEDSVTEYSAVETFIDKFVTVRDEGFLQSGSYSYFFRFVTSPDWFTSCETEFGHVRYELSLVVTRSNTYDNIFIKPVTFIKTLNLNSASFYTLPLEVESNHGRTSCLCGLLTSEIHFSMETPFYAYAPGQTIPITLRMFNISRSNIHNFYINFVRKITYEATEPTSARKTTERIIVHRGQLGGRVANNVLEDGLLLPPMPPTTIVQNAINIKYYLKAHMDHVCCLTSVLEAEKEIVIGTVPIRSSLSTDHLFNDMSRQDEEEARLEEEEGEIGASAYLPHRHYAIVPNGFEIDEKQESFVDREITPYCRIDYRPLYPMFTK